MKRDRVIVDFNTSQDAKKVEETVKTGYTETSIENLVHWIAVEEDMVETYGRLAGSIHDTKERSTFRKLHDESRDTLEELSKIQKSLEKLDRARVKRIEALSALMS
jgi:rubrerythrin